MDFEDALLELFAGWDMYLPEINSELMNGLSPEMIPSFSSDVEAGRKLLESCNLYITYFINGEPEWEN